MKEFIVTVKLWVRVPSEGEIPRAYLAFNEATNLLRNVKAEYEIEEVTEAGEIVYSVLPEDYEAL